MAILFVASEAFELKPLAQRLTTSNPLKWPLDYAEEGVWDGKRFLLAANGAGPRLAAQCVEVAIRATAMAELSASKLEAVVSVGVCGGLDPLIGINAVVVADRILAIDSGETFKCSLLAANLPYTEVDVVSTDHVVSSAVEKRKLAQAGGRVVEMEAAGVAQRALSAGIPFYCVKIVSDHATEELEMDFNKMRTPQGRFSRGKIVRHALTHPLVLSRLFQTKRQAEEAAALLGVFLASCRFQPDDQFEG